MSVARPRICRMLADNSNASTKPSSLRPPLETTATGHPPGEEFRESLVAVTSLLSTYSGIRTSHYSVGSEEWWPWERISKVLYEALADLQEPAPPGERLVGRAAILAMISDGLDLVAVDREFHFLLSVYMQACVLINLMNGEPVASERELAQQRAFRNRIRASLDFVAAELAELDLRRSRSAA